MAKVNLTIFKYKKDQLHELWISPENEYYMTFSGQLKFEDEKDRATCGPIFEDAIKTAILPTYRKKLNMKLDNYVFDYCVEIDRFYCNVKLTAYEFYTAAIIFDEDPEEIIKL